MDVASLSDADEVDRSALVASLQEHAPASVRSTSFGQWCVLVVALAVGGLVMGWFGSPLGGPSRLGEFPLVVDPKHTDFGEVWEQDRFGWTLPITNRSSEDIELEDIVGSCRCYSIGRRSLVIRAAETQDLRLTLDLTAFSPGAVEQESRPVEISLRPIIRGRRAAPPEWFLRGRVRRSLAYTPSLVEFHETLVHGHAFPSETVLVRSSIPLEDLSVEYDTAAAYVDSNSTDQEGRQFELRITPKETLPIGPFEFLVRVAGITQEGTRVPARPLTCRGVLARDIHGVPDVLRFPRERSGETPSEVTVVLQSRNGRQFAVEEVILRAEHLVVMPLASPMAAEHDFRVIRRSSPDAPTSGKILFLVCDQSGKRENVEVLVGAGPDGDGGACP